MGKRRIEQLDVDDVDLVADLWKELATHHAEVTEDWPTRDLDESWEMRRAQYVGWLESGEGVIFVVLGEGAEEAPLGYACLRIESSGPTWDLGEVAGDLETLSVAAAARGSGVGSELIAHCREHLAALGARWWGVGVIAGNDGAAALYEREGFRPFVHHLIAPIE